jgi:hypothetical protein
MPPRVLTAVVVMGVLLGVASSMAQQSDHRKVVGHFSIHLGIVPAEVVRGHAQTHPEGTMHGGLGTARDTHHVMVSILDERSGKQVGEAEVEARVGELGLSSVKKKLELMKIADSTTYGNYFRMAGRGRFQIDVEIRIPGEPRLTSTFFFNSPNSGTFR